MNVSLRSGLRGRRGPARSRRPEVEALEGRALLAARITAFPIPMTVSPNPAAIARGPDGNVWVTERSTGLVARISPTGAVTEFAVPGASGVPTLGSITSGPDGNLWFLATDGNGATSGRAERITPAGVVTGFPLPGVKSIAGAAITAGPDGDLWFTGSDANVGIIGRLTTAGALTTFPLPRGVAMPNSITVGPDGNLWFPETLTDGSGAGRVGRITPSGALTEIALPRGVSATSLTAGPDGALWFTEQMTLPTPPPLPANKIGRITTTGAITEFPVPADKGVNDLSSPAAITTGPDGNLWFTENGSDIIHRVTTSGVFSAFEPGGSTYPYNPAITAGPDGDLWFLTGDPSASGAIGRMTTAGVTHAVPLPAHTTDDPNIGNLDSITSLTAGPDGNLWFPIDNFSGVGPSLGRIGKITPAGVLTTFDVPHGLDSLSTLASGGDGALWFAESGANRIGRITTAGKVTEFPLPPTLSAPQYVTPGPDGAVWFDASSANPPKGAYHGSYVVRMTTAGAVTAFPLPDPDTTSGQIVAGSDGNLWFFASRSVTKGREDPYTLNSLDRMTTAGVVTEFPLARVPQPPVPSTSGVIQESRPAPSYFSGDDLIAGPGGALWFTESVGDPYYGTFRERIVRVSPTGRMTSFPIPAADLHAPTLAAGPDGNLWFSQIHPVVMNTMDGPSPDPVLGRVTTHGLVNVFPLPAAFQGVDALAAGPDGNLWFVDAGGTRIVRVALPSGPTGTLTPGSDSGPDPTDGITNVTRPTFAGLGRPGEVVRLVARPADGSAPRPLGAATVDLAGAWRLTARRPLPDGSYAVDNASGPSLSPLAPLHPLVIDTVPPLVTAFKSTTSAVTASPPGATVTFQDKGAGLDANLNVPTSTRYTLETVTRLRGAKPVYADSFAESPSTSSPNGPLSANLEIIDSEARPGDRYRVRIHARYFTDLAGNHLDGETHGLRFPSGDGRPGGDFVTVIDSTPTPKPRARKPTATA